ncbi:MAG: hypothetical protein WBQ25_11250 [Nitrososphaeraceae archaeon]
MAFSILMLALIIITTNQVKAQQGQNSHGLTPEQVKQFCRPDNPRLSFVNSTESEICGLPKSTPSTPALNSSGSSSGKSSPSSPLFPSSSSSGPSSSSSGPSSGSITPQAP